MCGVLGGVRRKEGSRDDLLISPVSDSVVCSSRFLSFWDKSRAPPELKSSKSWIEEGEAGDWGDGGNIPEEVEQNEWSWTAARDGAVFVVFT